MPNKKDNVQRLAQYVVARRSELGLTQAEAAALAQLAVATIQVIEAAEQERFRPVTMGAVDRALSWAPGSVASILAGGEPTPVAAEQELSRSVGVEQKDAQPSDDDAILYRRPAGISDEEWERRRPDLERAVRAVGDAIFGDTGE